MASCILNSERAVAVNIQVGRVFTKMRGILLTNKDILLKLEQLERRMPVIILYVNRLAIGTVGNIQNPAFRYEAEGKNVLSSTVIRQSCILSGFCPYT